MLNTNQYQLLIELLKRDAYVKAPALAKIIGVSTRSIHTYVKQINYIVKDELITSSNKGYYLSRSIYKKHEKDLISELPQDNYARAVYLIKSILQSSTLSIDSFDFIEEIYISFSTLRNVINKAKSILQDKGLKIVSTNNRLEIVGNHDQIRILKKDMVLDEASQNQITINVLNDVFGEVIVKRVLLFIDEYVKLFQIKIFDFSLLNITLHLCTILTTILETEKSHSKSEESYSKTETFVYQYIKKEFDLAIPLRDTQAIIDTINTFSTFNDKKNLESKRTNTSKLIEEIIKFIDDFYDINLENTEFISAFEKHIDNLSSRIHHNKKVHNPIINHIKNSTPYIYDIATNIGIRINRFFDRSVMTEDEVGFIALHLGSEIQRQNKKKNLIQTLLIIPDYIEKKTNLAKSIEKDFSDTLYIVDVSTNEEYLDFDLCEYELVISTLTHVVETNNKNSVIKISPFYTNADKIHLLEKIEWIQLQKSNILLKNYFDYFFNKDLFFIVNTDESVYKDKYMLINEMCSILEKKDYVNEGYSTLISERELLGSTKFNKIAVPHQTLISAKESGICTYFFPDGFMWDDDYVYFVFMIAIIKEDREQFQKIYESLLYTFEHSEVFTHLETITDFKSFKYYILSILTD